jgi:hypothetical protein
MTEILPLHSESKLKRLWDNPENVFEAAQAGFGDEIKRISRKNIDKKKADGDKSDEQIL